MAEEKSFFDCALPVAGNNSNTIDKHFMNIMFAYVDLSILICIYFAVNTWC